MWCMDRDAVWREIDAHRARVLDFFVGLSEAELRTPSLCAGWTVRNVSWPFYARRRFRGRRLRATDIDWARGEGEVIEAPMGDLLLMLTGRGGPER